MAGRERPVPVFVFRADVRIQLHNLVAGKFFYLLPREANSAVRMVDLNEVRILPQAVQFILLLGGQEGKEGVIVLYGRAAEHQFVELEGAVALLIHIHLQGGVVGMFCELVVIGKGDDIVAQAAVYRVCIGGVIGAFVHRPGTVHPGMRMEVGPFPAQRAVQRSIGVEDIRAAERPGRAKMIYGRKFRHQHQQYKQQEHGSQDFPYNG